MSDPSSSGAAEVRFLPVPAEAPEARAVERSREASLPAPLAAATGGMLVGMLTVMLVGLLRRSVPRRALVRRRRRQRSLEVVATRSFLVDVHMLKR
jgi:hypothetical protein